MLLFLLLFSSFKKKITCINSLAFYFLSVFRELGEKRQLLEQTLASIELLKADLDSGAYPIFACLSK